MQPYSKSDTNQKSKAFPVVLKARPWNQSSWPPKSQAITAIEPEIEENTVKAETTTSS